MAYENRKTYLFSSLDEIVKQNMNIVLACHHFNIDNVSILNFWSVLNTDLKYKT